MNQSNQGERSGRLWYNPRPRQARLIIAEVRAIMHPTINIAKRAAREAGKIMLRHLHRTDLGLLNVSRKQRNDFVSDVDRQAEAEIIRIIRHSHPNHSILAEESGKQGHDGEHEWIIDPLDGTTNFLHGIPHFAVSIAYRHRGRLESGLIYDPVGEEMFIASRGQGAMLNDHRIRVSTQNALDGALLGTGFPFRLPQHLDSYLDTFRAVMSRCGDIRRAGAAALDLAYVAAGRLDGFWEIGLAEWDLAAGCILVQESGGLVGDFAGGNRHLETGNVIAGTPKVFKGIHQAIHPTLPKALVR